MNLDDLHARVWRYRELASRITDERAIKALNDLADEYAAQDTETWLAGSEDDGSLPPVH